VLVAVDDHQILGTVMLEPYHAASEVARTHDEAEIRALAVAPDAQGKGVGRMLLHAVIDRAVRSRVHHLVLSTQPAMVAAQHLYAASGFIRLPDRDWMPAPRVPLLAYGRVLTVGSSVRQVTAPPR
jgi:ribosomal protein S18 acetylase RimI-like enzyme